MKRTIVTIGMIGAAIANVAAFEPSDLDRVMTAVGGEFPDAVVLEVDLEYSAGGTVVSVENDSGFELYINASEGRIVDRERDRLSWNDRRIADQIREDGDVVPLTTAYATLLDTARDDSSLSTVSPEYFTSIEYGVEYRDLVIEVTFEGRGVDTEVYLDPYTGEIITIEIDD